VDKVTDTSQFSGKPKAEVTFSGDGLSPERVDQFMLSVRDIPADVTVVPNVLDN